MKLRLIVFTLLALALSACGTVPTPELDTGVDDIGTYTVVARSGDETLSAQGRTQKLPTRVLEIREYSSSRYRGVFRITFPSYTKGGYLDASVGVGYGGTVTNYNREKLSGANPTSYSVASKLANMSSVKRGTQICANAEGFWGAHDNEGRYRYQDKADFEIGACYDH